MERFGDVLDTAQCSNNSIQFEFMQEVQFVQLQNEWSWVNDAEDNYIVLVTENSRCNIPDGDPTTRQPWHVTSAEFKDANNIVTLAAEPVTWEKAFSDWRLKVKSRGLLPSDSRKRSQHHAFNRRYEILGNPSIPLAHDFSGGELPLEVGDSSALASITCDPCYTTGSLDFEIDVIPWVMGDPANLLEGPHLDGYVAVIANDIGASFTAVSAANAPLTNGASGDVNLWSWSPPDLGISIKDVLHLGLTLELDVAGNFGQTTASFNLSSGVAVTFPDDSIYKVVFNDSSQNENYGWTPHFAATTPSMSESVSVSGSVGTQLRLNFGGDVIGIGVGVGIMLAAPTLELEATAIAQPDACGISGAQYGVEFEVDLGASIDAYEGITIAGIPIAATQTLIGISTELLSTCFTISDASATPVSSIPSGNYSYTLSGSSVIAGSSSAVVKRGYVPHATNYPEPSNSKGGWFTSHPTF